MVPDSWLVLKFHGTCDSVNYGFWEAQKCCEEAWRMSLDLLCALVCMMLTVVPLEIVLTKPHIVVAM